MSSVFEKRSRSPVHMIKPEHHRMQHSNWLRAAVLGANDGIVSTASLIAGVAAAGTTQAAVLVAGMAAAVAGALSMAAGEYVSVSSQADIESADIEREKHELRVDGEREQMELTAIYVQRGLELNLARQVAAQLTAHDALGAHIRDELGISDHAQAKPITAALASAAAFLGGATLPMIAAWLAPANSLIAVVSLLSLIFLAGLGALSARVGGAPMLTATLRVTFWGAAAMAITAGVGKLFGTVV